MKGKFDALKYAKSLEKQLSADPRKKKRQDDIARLQAGLAEEKNRGADVSVLGGLLSDAATATDKGDFARADELLSRAEQGLRGLQPQSIEDEIARIKERVNDVDLLGLDNSRAAELIAQAEQAIRTRDHRSARKLAQAAQKEAEKALEGSVLDALPYAESLLAECERTGMDVAALKGTLTGVRELLEKREFNSALQACTSLIEEIEPRRRAYFRNLVSRVSEAVEGAREPGLEKPRLEGSIAKARQLIDAKDFEAAAGILRGIEAAVLAGPGPVPEGEGVQALEELLRRVEALGLASGDLRGELDGLRRLGANDPLKPGAAAGLRKKLEVALAESTETSALLEQLRGALSAGTKMGLDVKGHAARLHELEGLMRARRFGDARSGTLQTLEKLREHLKQRSEGAIASLEEEVSRFRRGGASVVGPEKVLTEAREALGSGRHEEAFALARRTVDELDALRDALDGYGRAIEKCGALMADAREQKIDCTMAQPLVDEAKEAASRGEFVAAADRVSRALEILNGAIRGATGEGIQYSLGLVARSDGEGTHLEDVERLALEGLSYADEGDFRRAGESAQAIERLVGAQTRAGIMARDALDKAGETMAEAMMEMLDVSGESGKLALAMESLDRGEYEGARYMAEDVAPALRQRCREALDQAIGTASSMVDEFGKSGAEIPRAREYLRRARELSECGRFGLGHSYAVQAVQEARSVGERFREAQDARAIMESMLESARTLGVAHEELESALVQVGSEIEKGAYEAAVATSAAGIEKGEMHFSEKARSLQDGLSRLLSSLQSLPVDRSLGESALKAARDHLKREENAEATEAMRGPVEALSAAKRTYDDATAQLEAAGKRIDEGENFGIAAGEARADLEAAAKAYRDGAFADSLRSSNAALEQAEHLVSERAAQAVGELRDLLEETERAGTVLDDLHERVGALSGAFSSKSFSGLFKETVAIRAEIARRKARHAEATAALGAIQTAIESIKTMGADVSPTEDLLGLARFASERGSYDDVLDYSRRAGAELTAAAESALHKQHEGLSRRLEELGRDGVELGACSKALAENAAIVSEGDFKAALADLRRIETEIEVRRDQFRNTQKVLSTAESRLSEAGDLGVSTAESAQLLASARKAAAAGDYPRAVELAEQSRDTVARNVESHQQTIGAIELARAHVREAESMGADVARPKELLERAASMFAGHRYDEAMGLVAESETETLRSQETLVADTAALARSTLDEAAKIGADMNGAKELLGRAEAARQARDFESAFALARESYESAQESRARHSAALGALSEIQKMVQNAQSEGVRVERLLGELERAKDSLQRFDYDACTGTADRVRRQAEELIGSAADARRELERCESAMRSASDIRADTTEGEKLLSASREQYGSGDYRAALAGAGACFARLSAAQHEVVWNELGRLLLELGAGEDEGADVSAAVALVDEAGMALAGGDFSSALLRCHAGRARLAEARHSFEGIHNVMLASRLIVEEARYLDADVVVASDLSAGAREMLRSRNYHGAQELALQAAEEATRSQRTLIAQIISTAEKAVSESESWGIRSRISKDRLARAKNALEFQDFKGARDLLEECDDSLAQAISDHKAASEMMASLTDSMVRAEALGLDLASARRGASEAESMVARGEYARALDAYKALEGELSAAERELVTSRMAAVRKALEEAGAQGIFVRAQTETLARAEEALGSGDLAGASELASGASRALEANRRENRRVGAMVQELSSEVEGARSGGVEVPAAQEALARAGQLLLGGAYGECEEEVRRGRAAVASVLAEAMQARLAVLGNELREAEMQGIRSARAGELFKEADRSCRSRSYPEMLQRIDESRRELSAARRSREEIQRGLESMGQRLKETEGLGADGEAASALVGRAMEVSSEGNYLQALELLEDAKNAVEAAQNVRVQEFLAAAQGQLDEGESIGADTKQARKTLGEARKALEEKDYPRTAGLARSALEDAELRVSEHRRHVELVAAAEKSLQDAEDGGLNMERLRRGLEESRRALRKYEYPAVVAAVDKIQKESQTLLRQSSEARRIISFCERKIESARKIGAEVSSAESTLAEARSATEKRIFVKAFELATRCLRQIDSMQHAVVLGYLTDGEVHLAEMEEAGADISEPSDLIEVAIEALNENEFEKAMELGRQAVELSRGKMAQHELSAESLRELERKMKDASELGGDIRNLEGLHEKGREALREHDHDRLTGILGEAMDALVGSLHDLVLEKSREASAIISEVEEIGANVARSRDRILRSRRALECGDFKTALNQLEDSIRAADAARRRHAETLEGIKGLQNMAREAAELGLDVSRARRALAEVDESIDDGFYDQADRLIAESRAEMEKGYLKHAEDALARTEEALRKARELGTDVGPEERSLSECRAMFSQGRFQTVLKACKDCQRRLDERLNEHIAGVILDAENLIGESGKIGVDAREFKELLERSEDTVSEGNYETALRLANEAIDRTKMLLRSSVSGTISTLGGLIEESRRIGADVREVEEFSHMSLAALQKDEFELAHDHALSGIAAVDRVREEFIVRRRQEIEQKIHDAEEMGAQVEDFRRSIAKAQEFLERADFEKAALLLAETEESTLKRQARVSEESIRKADELLAKVKMDIDLSKARSLLEEARAALGAGEYEEAVDYSARCTEETGRVQRQFVEEVIGSSEETIAAATEMGADTHKALELLEYARAEREAGNHDNSLEKAVQSSEEAEQAQYDFVRGPIEHIRRVMKEAKLSDDPRIKKLIASAEQYLEKKDYPEARREVLRAQELTSEIQERLARKEIMDAEDIVAMVEKSGALSPLSRNLLRSALNANNGRDFEKAMKFARECGVQAMKTKDEFSSAEKALKAAESEIAMLSEMNLKDEETADLFNLAKSNFASGDYVKSKEYSTQVGMKAERSYVKAAGEVLSSSQFKINYARNIGADVSAAESLLREAKAAHEAKDFKQTLELARRCREEAERAKERYKELVDTIYSAESKISVAHTYGLDTSAAERLLSMAVAQKSKNGEEALDFARQSMEEVQRALEKFTPDIKVDIKLEGVLQKEKWSQATLTVSNTGKATAKEITVRFSGELDVQGGEKVPVLRGGESRKQGVRVRPAKGGDLPLGVSVMSLREFDGKEFKSQETRWIRVEDATPLATPLNQFVTKSVRCHICLGTIKSGLPLVRCECGKTYHETCASRVGECPNCGRDLRNSSPAGGS